METLKAKLFRLFKDEIHDLNLGHTFNKMRLKEMKRICRLLLYYQYIDVSSKDLAKMVNFYEYN